VVGRGGGVWTQNVHRPWVLCVVLKSTCGWLEGSSRTVMEGSCCGSSNSCFVCALLAMSYCGTSAVHSVDQVCWLQQLVHLCELLISSLASVCGGMFCCWAGDVVLQNLCERAC
jgi:hypothetical protein